MDYFLENAKWFYLQLLCMDEKAVFWTIRVCSFFQKQFRIRLQYISKVVRHGEVKAYQDYVYHFDLPVPYLHKINTKVVISIGGVMLSPQ